MSDAEFDTKLREIVAKDPRYARNAYVFAFQALEYTMREYLKLSDTQRRHVSAQEILEGMRRFAIDQCGFMARNVWESWGIYSTADWGNVIYNLIAANLMKQNDEDDLAQFRGVYSFDDAFDRNWTFSPGKTVSDG
ncbi:MAG: hypothetical protein L6Q71_08495 [Planctomycetes bacterium]|nr:hypothetical protein [Planctomycetota bacterium]NUQ34636.1 hypothetical protein [Planctomycetaceae bacterium]